MSIGSSKILLDMLSRDNVMIITHRSPDGDTVGTAYALKRVFENRGKSATVVCSDEIGKRLRFISDGAYKLDEPTDIGCVIAVDTATVDLMGEKLKKYADKVDYCIDHHITNTNYAKCTFLNSSASSTGEYLYDLLKEAKVEIDGYIAEKLYAAIAFDTGCFKYSNVTPHTHMVAAELLEYGMNFEDINRRLFDIASFEQLKIEQEVLMAVERYRDNTVTILVLTQDMLKKVGTDIDIDGLTAITRRIEGTLIGISIREMSDGVIKVSFRSMDDRVDVSKIAAKFGGGGHKRASGCSFNAPIDEVKNRILDGVFEEWNKVFGEE